MSYILEIIIFGKYEEISQRFEELWRIGDMKTVFVDVEKEIAPIVGSRDVVKALERRMDTAKKIVLDFKNVELVSRYAAHVLFRI